MFLLLLVACSEPSIDDPEGLWVGSYRDIEGCVDGDVTMRLRPLTDRSWHGVYSFTGTEAGYRGDHAEYELIGTKDGDRLTLTQPDLSQADPSKRWCRGTFTLVHTRVERSSAWHDALSRWVEVEPQVLDVLSGKWVSQECGCVGILSFRPMLSL